MSDMFIDDGTVNEGTFIDGEPPEEPVRDPDDPTTWAPTADAPYGFLKNGNPRKRRPNKAGSKRPGGGRRRKSSVNYAGIVHDLIMSVATPLMIGGAALQNVSMTADGWLLADRAGPIATAMGDIAAQDARIAAALEKVAEVSPYAALTAAVMPAIPQLLVNHGVLRPGIMGTIDPQAIADQMFRRQEQEGTPGDPPFDYDLPSEEMSGNGATN